MNISSNGESSSGVMENDRRSEGLGELRVLPDQILSSILTNLAPRDVARLSCVSSVMYIFCNEEPLWMTLCLGIVNPPLEYKGSWKNSTFHQLGLPFTNDQVPQEKLRFDGFSSLFLYRRYYRCYTTLNGFSFDNGNVERRDNLSPEEFSRDYDGRKPVLINGLADNWPAKTSWSDEQLLLKHSDTQFKISGRSSKKIKMKLKDYISYTQTQHDEDPLYIFDDKFGEAAPDLLKDYSVPHLFQEDYFDILEDDQRPAYRWLIIGPERSGASWHVDPALTSAWNTLLCGRKRWALYPPGRVPLGVTVHVNEEDGDVNIETPSSLQWWLDFYPLLGDDDKPIECTQLPGETIYVPSGWWHCVLNLETTIAVTQNYVNANNFEFVCLDMAPGYRHKGICRAGLLALDEDFDDIGKSKQCMENKSSYSDLTRKEKRVRICQSIDSADYESCTNGISANPGLGELQYSYDVDFLAMYLDEERDHYNSLWSSGNCIGQREMRGWLWKLWLGRPELRDLIWKGACLALNAGKWSQRVREICAFHGLPLPLQDEILPVGTGSNPVYLVGDNVIKVFVEEGLETSLYGLGTELEFYNLLHTLTSPLKNYIPAVLACGILLFENGSYRVLPWDGSSVHLGIDSCNLKSINDEVDSQFGVWGKKIFEHEKAGRPVYESGNSGKSSLVWPYVVTKRCRGKIFAELRDTLSSHDALNLASFLGEQLRSLHLVPLPSPSTDILRLMTKKDKSQPSYGNGFQEKTADRIGDHVLSKLFISILSRKRKGVSCRLTEWGEPIPSKLIEKIDEYLPRDLTAFLDIFKDETEICKSCTWIHSDIMDDNIYMTPCCSTLLLDGNTCDPYAAEGNCATRSSDSNGHKHSWHPSHLLDFSDLSIGDPILDLIPIYLDIFRGDPVLLKQFLDSYRLPFLRKETLKESVKDKKFGRLSYRAMCYCMLHDENILGAVFSLWKELRMAESWEEIEQTVWGDLNNYASFS